MGKVGALVAFRIDPEQVAKNGHGELAPAGSVLEGLW
jgi:hypothetical protein